MDENTLFKIPGSMGELNQCPQTHSLCCSGFLSGASHQHLVLLKFSWMPNENFPLTEASMPPGLYLNTRALSF